MNDPNTLTDHVSSRCAAADDVSWDAFQKLMHQRKTLLDAILARAARPSVKEEDAEVFVAIHDIMKLQFDWLHVLGTTTLVRLDLKPTDALLVKLGDAGTGWIPSQETEDQVAGLFRLLLAELKKPVPVIVGNYTWDVSALDLAKIAVLRTEAEANANLR